MKNPPLYALSKIFDHPSFEGFAFPKGPSLIGRENRIADIQPASDVDSNLTMWRVPELAKTWKAPVLEGRVRPFNDSPGMLWLPVFSKRAVDELSDLLLPFGELLPVLDTRGGEWWFYNCRTVVDCLDRKKSKCDICEGMVMDIEYFWFKKERLPAAPVFRVMEDPLTLIVTQEFKDRVFARRLNGFVFIKLWPLKKGEYWRTFGVESTNAKDSAVKKQTLEVVVSLRKTPEARVQKFMDAADELLRTSSLSEPVIGSLEGHETSRGQMRLLFSCPNAKILEEKLQPALAPLGPSVKVTRIRRSFTTCHS